MAKPQLKIEDELVVIDDGKDYHFDNIPEELRFVQRQLHFHRRQLEFPFHSIKLSASPRVAF